MTLRSVSLSFFILVFFLQFYGVDSYSCESQVRNCASIDTKCIYTGYKLTDEERFRLRPNVSIPGPAGSIPLLFDNNINTTFRTGAKPVQGKPVVAVLDLRSDYFIRVIRLSINSPASSKTKTFTFRVILGQRDQNPCVTAEFTGAGAEELVVVLATPTKARYIRIENVNNPDQTAYNELVVIGTPQRFPPEMDVGFIRYNHSINNEMGQSKSNLSGKAVEGSNVDIAFRHIWVSTPDDGAIIVRENFLPAAYRTDGIPNKCLVGYGVGLRETSRGNRRFSFNWVNGLKILRLSLLLLNMGLNNTDGATKVSAQLFGYLQGQEKARGREVVHVYNTTRNNANPCTVRAHYLYFDFPQGVDRVDLVLSHWKGTRLFQSSTEPIVIGDVTYDLQNPSQLPPVVVSETSPPSREECLNNQLLNLQSIIGTSIALPNVTISVSRSFSQDSLIVVQQGTEPAAYREKNITNNCLGGAGVGLRRTSKEPRLFNFDFGNRILTKFSLVLVLGDENPFNEQLITAQLIGWNGKKKTLSEPIDINLAEVNKRRAGACEKDGRYTMVLEDPKGFSRVEFLSQARGTMGFGSRLPLALSDICFVIDKVQPTPAPITVVPMSTPHRQPFKPFGQCLSYELGEHSFDPTGLKVEGDSALPFRHFYVNTSIGSSVIVQSGRLPTAYRVNGVPNDCLSGYGIAPLQPATPVVNKGFTIQFISGYLVKHFGVNLINYGNENTDRAKVVRVQMVGLRDGRVRYVTAARSIDYTTTRAGEWNPCTIPEGHSFYMDPGPESFDRIDLVFQHSLDGVNFFPGTSESVVLTDLCYDLFQPFELPPSAQAGPTAPFVAKVPTPTGPVGGSCLGTELQERRTNPIGQPVSGPRAYAFFHLWITPLLRNTFTNALEAKYPVVVQRSSQPALYTLNSVPNECMLNGSLGVGFLQDKHLEIQGFDFRVVNGRAFSILSFQLLNFERFDYVVRLNASQNGVPVQQKTFTIKAITHMSSRNICQEATNWIWLQSNEGFDAVQATFEPLSPSKTDTPFSVNRVALSSLCYTVIRG